MSEKSLRWLEYAKFAPASYGSAPRATDEVLQQLMLAVLSDAINCYQEHLKARDRRGQRLFDEASQWLMSDEREYVFSFETICEALGFDPGYLRSGLASWTNRERNSASSVPRRRRRTRPAERRRRIVATA